MSPRSKRDPRADPEMPAADAAVGRALAEDADSTGVIHADWRERILDGQSTEELIAKAGKVKFCHVKMGNELAALASKCAGQDRMSRDSWVRKTVALAVAERTGVPYEQLMEPLGVSYGRYKGGRAIQ